MLTHTCKTDAEVQQDVLKHLRWHSQIDPAEIGVQVDAGVVTLVGNVESYAKKVAAKEAAHSVAGVLDVVNELVVKPPGHSERTDQQIAHAVRHALEWDATVPHPWIRTTVSNGYVTLEGDVDFRKQVLDAERCVERLTGVRGIDNRMTVRPTPRIDAASMRQAIEEALDRQAHWDADRIGIEVKEGVVRLTGRVRSWAEKKIVHRVASFTPGVRHVDDRLYIEG